MSPKDRDGCVAGVSTLLRNNKLCITIAFADGAVFVYENGLWTEIE